MVRNEKREIEKRESGREGYRGSEREREMHNNQCYNKHNSCTCVDQLTHSDVVEPVERFVSCSDTHCNRMISLTTLKSLHERSLGKYNRLKKIMIIKIITIDWRKLCKKVQVALIY